MAFTSLSGSISHFREGNVNRRLGLLLGAFGAAGAFCGAHISSGLASATLKPLTGVVLMLSAFLIYLRVFHPANPLFSFRFHQHPRREVLAADRHGGRIQRSGFRGLRRGGQRPLSR